VKGISKYSTIIGAVVLVGTIIIYILAKPISSSANILGLCFLLYSEIVFFGNFNLIEYLINKPKTSHILTVTGVGVPIAIYAVVVFITALIYMNMNLWTYRQFLIIQVLLFLAVVIITVVLAGFSKAASMKDAKELQADAMIRNFEAFLRQIKDQTDRKQEINKLIEALKYSDTSVMVDADIEINQAINKLSNLVKADQFDENGFEQAIKELEHLIKKRNIQAKNTKLGGI